MKYRVNTNKVGIEYWISVGMVCVVLVGMQLAGVEGVIREPVEFGARPLLYWGARVHQVLIYPFQVVASAHSAARRIQDLEIKYSYALAQVGTLRALEQENQELRRLLENTDRTLSPTVLSRPIISYGNPLVSAGSNSNVRTGDLVMINGVLVGTIDEVSSEQSTVTLLTQPAHQPLVVKTNTLADGILTGDGTRLVLSEVLATQSLAVGDVVLTAGQPGVPPDITIGTVTGITSDDALPTKEALVEPAADFFATQLVEIRTEHGI